MTFATQRQSFTSNNLTNAMLCMSASNGVAREHPCKTPIGEVATGASKLLGLMVAGVEKRLIPAPRCNAGSIQAPSD